MITVFLSQFWIQRLGWALLHFLWQGTGIVFVYAMLRSLLGHSLSSQGRYTLACLALVAMAAAPPPTLLLIPNEGGIGSWTISAARGLALHCRPAIHIASGSRRIAADPGTNRRSSGRQCHDSVRGG